MSLYNYWQHVTTSKFTRCKLVHAKTLKLSLQWLAKILTFMARRPVFVNKKLQMLTANSR